MAKFFYSKSNATSQAQQSNNGIILNGSNVRFYKNKVNTKTLSGGTISNMPTASNILNKLPNVVKSRYLQYFDNSTINNNPKPAGTTFHTNAFAYMASNYTYIGSNTWDVTHMPGQGNSEYIWPIDYKGYNHD